MLALAIILSFLMLLVLFFDIRSYIIPNWLVGVVLVFYPALLLFSPEAIDWPMGLAAMFGSFVIGFILFNSKVMGGGDVKLLAACCLWTGVAALPVYLLYTTLLGGALSLFLLLGRPVITYYTLRLRRNADVPRLFRNGEPVPYGVAIAGAFLILIWESMIPGLKW